MPSKNSVKLYIENGYYHIYNRGVEKRIIFQDQQDYAVFLNYLKTYLLPKNEDELREKLADAKISYRERDRLTKLLRLNNFANEVNLLAYCLMPNHFHLLIRQTSYDGIDRFMNSLSTRYVVYFNRKYKRIGPLFQDVYKAVVVETEPQLLYLTAYIHRNPLSLISIQGVPLHRLRVQPSSYLDYLGLRHTEWIKRDDILAYFSKTNALLSYQTFVEGEPDFTSIASLTVEDE